MLPQTPEIEEKLRRLRELEEAEEQFEQERIVQAGRRLDCFLEYVMKDEKTAQSITLSAIHRQWIDHIFKCWSMGLYAGILAPFGHGKTAVIGVGLPLFTFGTDPSLRVKLVSSNDDIARDRVDLIRQYIEGSPEYKAVFPNVRASTTQPWSRGKLYLARETMAKDASLQAVGAGSSGIGSRADLIIFDDLNDMRNTLHHPKLREQVQKNIQGVFLTRLDPGTNVAMVATRWHEQDVVGTILNDEKMRQKWGFLIQRVNKDITAMDCEIILGNKGSRPLARDSKIDDLLKLYEAGVISFA